MLQDLNRETLESKRTKPQLVMMYKIINDLVDIPCDAYLTPATTRTRAIHSKKLLQQGRIHSSTAFFHGPYLCGICYQPQSLRPLTWYSSSRGRPLSHSKLGRGQHVSKIRGFWSCAGWATIPRGSYCSRIGLLPNEDSNMQAGNFPFFRSCLSNIFLSFLFFLLFLTTIRDILFKLERSLSPYRNRNRRCSTSPLLWSEYFQTYNICKSV